MICAGHQDRRTAGQRREAGAAGRGPQHRSARPASEDERRRCRRISVRYGISRRITSESMPSSGSPRHSSNADVACADARAQSPSLAAREPRLACTRLGPYPAHRPPAASAGRPAPCRCWCPRCQERGGAVSHDCVGSPWPNSVAGNPQHFGQLIERYGPAWIEQQRGQQRPLHGRQRDRRAVAAHQHRAEQAELGIDGSCILPSLSQLPPGQSQDPCGTSLMPTSRLGAWRR
jgi:hypothetical protein